MRRTEILRRVTIILIAVICLAVVGIRVYEIKKADKVTENVESVIYNCHKYLYFKNAKCIVHDVDCTYCARFRGGKNVNDTTKMCGHPSGTSYSNTNQPSRITFSKDPIEND